MFVKKYAIYEMAAVPRYEVPGPAIVLHIGLGGVHNSPEEAVQYLKENRDIFRGSLKRFVILETWQYDECAVEEGLEGIPL